MVQMFNRNLKYNIRAYNVIKCRVQIEFYFLNGKQFDVRVCDTLKELAYVFLEKTNKPKFGLPKIISISKLVNKLVVIKFKYVL